MRMRQPREDRMIEAVHKIKTGIHVLYVNRDLSNHLLSPFQREEINALLAQGHTTHCHWNNESIILKSNVEVLCLF